MLLIMEVNLKIVERITFISVILEIFKIVFKDHLINRDLEGKKYLIMIEFRLKI